MSLEQGLSHRLCCRRAGPSLQLRQAARSPGPAAPQPRCAHGTHPSAPTSTSRCCSACTAGVQLLSPKPKALKDATCLGISVGVQPSQTSLKAVVSKLRGVIRSPAIKGQAHKAQQLPCCPPPMHRSGSGPWCSGLDLPVPLTWLQAHGAAALGTRPAQPHKATPGPSSHWQP